MEIFSYERKRKGLPLNSYYGSGITVYTLNLLAPELFFLILAHSVYKM